MNPAAILADSHFPDLKDYVLSHTGLSYYADKNQDLAARMARRMDVLDAADCGRYLQILQGRAGTPEMERLVGELTIGETYFFRQVEHFEMLRSVIVPQLLEQNVASRRIRIWSAGCATGEEPYSIAILLEREFVNRLDGWDVSILATDINTEFLARAREGRYSEWAFRATPREIRDQCFEGRGKTWKLWPEYRKRVIFEQLNLVDAAPALAEMFDLIVCRNVMIYFGNDLIHGTVDRFWQALQPGGWLIVGHAEFDLTAFAKFERVCLGDASAYRKLVSEPATPPREPRLLESGLLAKLPANDFVESEPPSRLQLPLAAPMDVAPPAAMLREVRELADRGLWQAAAALGRQLTDSNPLSAAAHFTLGLILENVASPADAEQALRRAIYLDRDFALAHYHLATCLQSGGKREQARKCFRNVVQLLEHRPAAERVEHGDGMTAADLIAMAKMHLEISEARERAI
jgi:chemotaxis protein methyltransferase CheR